MALLRFLAPAGRNPLTFKRVGRLGADVLIQSLLFGSVHFQWGVGGMLVTFVMGVAWGSAFLLCGRNLWIVILAHSTGHILMAIQLYMAPPVSG